MATVINNPTSDSGSGMGGMGFFLGILVLVLFFIGLIFYGVPYVKRGFSNAGTQINVPDKVDVNVQTPKQ